MSNDKLTILFMHESAYGPTNQCIGIGYRLLNAGHRVVFAAEASWAGKLTALGFEEDLVDLAPPAEDAGEQDAGQFWKDFIRETAPEFRKPTIDQLETFMKPTWQALIDGAVYCEPQLKQIIERVKPDVIVEDNVIAFPALMTADAPFIRIVSCNPLEVKGPNVAPAYSGLPQDDRSEWDAFKAEYRRTHFDMWSTFNEWVVAQGAPALEELEFIHESEHANLYVFPEVADYTADRPLNSTWHRMDSSVRETDHDWQMPEALKNRPADSALIYLSLGSLGSADVDLMRRLVDVLKSSKHRFIVSKGPQHSEFELADNMVGSEFLPQTKIMPLVDLVITHGGNNTITEGFHFGKPMIVLPLFWDQYDNAQRVDETGFGVRLSTYSFTDDEMHGAIDKLLNDHDLRARMKTISADIQARDGLAVAANVILDVAASTEVFDISMLDAAHIQLLVPPQRRHQFVDATAEWVPGVGIEGALKLLRLGDGRTLVVPTADDGQSRAVAGSGAAIKAWELNDASSALRWQRLVEDSFESESAFDVDQTNESLILDGRVVMKWQLFAEPSAAIKKETLLAAADFEFTPKLWGHLIDEQSNSLLASAVAFIPHSVDGWTWCPRSLAAGETEWAAKLGRITALMHNALAVDAVDVADAQLIHGDFHVGQILRAGDAFFIIDFEGDPLQSFSERGEHQSPLRDVASMSSSIIHAGMVAIKNGADRAAIYELITRAREQFLSAYLATSQRDWAPTVIAEVDALVDELEQRELVYAQTYLERWLYAPLGAIEYLREMNGR